MNWNEYVQLQAGLISVVNPISAMPIYLSLTARKTPLERRQTALTTAFAVAMVLLVALLAGEPILRFFGIGLPAFRVAGGLLLLLMGISMLRVSDDRSRHTPEENAESHDKESVAVVPLAMPLLAPLADFAEVGRATTITAWIMGHGLALMMAPTSVVLVGGLAIAKVGYEKYLRFAWPLLLALFIVSAAIIGAFATLAG